MTVVAVDIRATAVEKMMILLIGVHVNLTPTVIAIVTVTMVRLLHNVDQPRL